MEKTDRATKIQIQNPKALPMRCKDSKLKILLISYRTITMARIATLFVLRLKIVLKTPIVTRKDCICDDFYYVSDKSR